MDNFETVLMLKQIESEKYGKGLLKDIAKIYTWYIECDNEYQYIDNAYKCLTLAISLYIKKCSSALPMYIYHMKRSLEHRILSLKLLCSDKPTYEWLIDTFQYVKDIPASTPNSAYTHNSGKQVKCEHNSDFLLLNKIALLVEDKTIPFTIDYNNTLGSYYANIIPNIVANDVTVSHLLSQLSLLQVLKSRADPAVTYTIFEAAIEEVMTRLIALNRDIGILGFTDRLYESIAAIKIIDKRYITSKD